jgi:recombination protein RecA
MNEGKKRAIDSAIALVRKTYGEGSIMKLSQKAAIRTAVIPSSIPLFNVCTGVGGIPKSRIIEIFGNESSGKTTFSLDLVANCQKQGGTAAYVDAEHALDKDWAKTLGVDVNELIISQPDVAEEALDIVETLTRAGIDLVVLDSVAAMVTRAEVEGDMGDSHMGLTARLMGQAMRKIGASCAKSTTAVIMINQTRFRIGVFYGDPMTTPGGQALKFWSSLRVRVSASKESSGPFKGEAINQKFKLVKNKVAPPFKECSATLVHGLGYNRFLCLMQAGEAYGFIKKVTGGYTFEDTKMTMATFGKEEDALISAVLEQFMKEDLEGDGPTALPEAAAEANEGEPDGEIDADDLLNKVVEE